MIAIVPAGGRGLRFGADIPKQFIRIGGVPIIIRTIRPFLAVEKIEKIIIGVRGEWFSLLKNLTMEFFPEESAKNKILFVAAGDERFITVYNALRAIKGEYPLLCTPRKYSHTAFPPHENTLIVIHDAVRPFVTPHFIEFLIREAEKHGNVVPVSQPVDAIRITSNDGKFSYNISRKNICLVQTPQIFRFKVLYDSYTALMESFQQGPTDYPPDDATVVEKFSQEKIHLVQGLPGNIKITYREELEFTNFGKVTEQTNYWGEQKEIAGSARVAEW